MSTPIIRLEIITLCERLLVRIFLIVIVIISEEFVVFGEPLMLLGAEEIELVLA